MPLKLEYRTDLRECDIASTLTADALEELDTALQISLLCDARALDADPVPDGASRRGFWADAFGDQFDAPDPDGPTGSRLWLLEAALVTEANARLAETYAAEALGWLKAGRYARSIELEGLLDATDGERILLGVDVTLRDGRHLRRTVSVTRSI